MIVNGYKITPAPVEYLPFRAYVEYEEGATERYMFLDESPARYAAKDAGMLGEAAVTHTPVEGFALLASVSFASPDSPTGQGSENFGNWYGTWLWADEVSDRGRAALAYLEWLEARDAAS